MSGALFLTFDHPFALVVFIYVGGLYRRLGQIRVTFFHNQDLEPLNFASDCFICIGGPCPFVLCNSERLRKTCVTRMGVLMCDLYGRRYGFLFPLGCWRAVSVCSVSLCE